MWHIENAQNMFFIFFGVEKVTGSSLGENTQ